MKIAEALGQIQSSQPKMKLRDALMQVNPAYARAKKAEEARIVAEKTKAEAQKYKAEAQKYEENARFWETIAHPSGALKSFGTEIVGTTKAVGADLVNVLTPWNQNKISDVQFGGKTFQTPSAKGAEAGTLARQGEYKKAAGKLGEAGLDIISTVTPSSITIKALKAGSILRAFLGGGLATAPIGAGYGATGAMQEGAGTGDILKQSAKGAGIAFISGGTLASIPGGIKAITKAVPKIEEVIGKLTTKETKILETELTSGKTPEQAIDTVLQSRPLESVKKTDAQVKETVSEPKTEVKTTPEDPLIQEARKYKSAEEFIASKRTVESNTKVFEDRARENFDKLNSGEISVFKNERSGKWNYDIGDGQISSSFFNTKAKTIELANKERAKALEYLKNNFVKDNTENLNKVLPTKSQLTDLWKKAQEKPIDTSLPEQLKPDVTPTTVEKGESVTAKKMNERFGKDEQMSTEYDVIGINNESDKAASLILKDRNKAIKTAFTDTGSNTEKIAILNELFEKSVVDNDHELSTVLFNRIKQLSTQTAQSLNMFKALTEVNPHYSYMSEVVSARLNGVRLSAGNIIDALKKESKQSRVRTKLSKQTQELKETLSNSVKYEKAQKVFNDLIC
jgi:hypothetical protein